MNQSGEFHTHDGIHYHTHDHEDAHVHSGEGEHHHNHSHTHDPQQVRAIVNRLKRSIGHLDKVRRMVEDGEDCADSSTWNTVLWKLSGRMTRHRSTK